MIPFCLMVQLCWFNYDELCTNTFPLTRMDKHKTVEIQWNLILFYFLFISCALSGLTSYGSDFTTGWFYSWLILSFKLGWRYCTIYFIILAHLSQEWYLFSCENKYEVGPNPSLLLSDPTKCVPLPVFLISSSSPCSL